jgi:hypothetical protein
MKLLQLLRSTTNHKNNMKSINIIKAFLAFLFLAIPVAKAQTTTVSDSVSLAWDAVTQAGGPGDTIKGYKIYFGKDPAAYTHVKELGSVTAATISLPGPGKWYFVCVAVNSSDLESLPSNQVEYETTGEFGMRPETPGLRFVSATTTKATTVVTVENIIRVP